MNPKNTVPGTQKQPNSAFPKSGIENEQPNCIKFNFYVIKPSNIINL